MQCNPYYLNSDPDVLTQYEFTAIEHELSDRGMDQADIDAYISLLEEAADWSSVYGYSMSIKYSRGGTA
jgi:uncharacterized protein Smg (DUF494 family)